MNTSNLINKKKLNLVLLGIFLFVLAIASPWFNLSISNHTFVKSYFSFFGSGLLFLIILFLNKDKSVNDLNFSALKILSIVIFLLGLISIFWSVNFHFTTTKIFLWITLIFSFVLGSNLNIDLNELKKISWVFLFTGGIIAAIGLLQFYLQPFNLAQAVSPGSTFGNKNVANQVLILFLPFSYYLLLIQQDKKILSWLIALLMSGILLFIFITENRSVLLGLIAQLILLTIFLFFQSKKETKLIHWDLNKTIACLAGIFLVFVLIKPPNLIFGNHTEISSSSDSFSRSIQIENNSEKQISQDSRFHIWSAALKMIKDKPVLGSGLGTFAHNIGNEGYTSYQIKGFQRAHNDFLEIGVELGIIGITLIVFLIIAILFSIRKIHKNSYDEKRLFFFVVFISLSGSFINAQFSFPYQQAMPLFLFGLFLGIIDTQYSNISSPLLSFKITLRKWMRKVILGLFVIIFLSISYIYLGWINSYNIWNQNNIDRTYNDLSFLETPIYHSGIFSLLSRTSAKYSKNNDYKSSINIDKFIQKFWPNHIQSLFRLGYSYQQIGQNKQALKYADELKKIEPEGLYGSYIIKMLADLSENNTSEFHSTFNELYSKPEKLLSIDTNTYHYLLFFTLESKNFTSLAPKIYKKYFDYHGFSCEVENNIAIHYFNLEEFEKSALHVQNAFKNDDWCLNPLLIEYLKEMEFLESSE